MKAHTTAPRTLRRSVALPTGLVSMAMARAPIDLRGNVNGLVRLALEEFVAHRRAQEFDQAMAAMAADPALQAAAKAISADFADADDDGLL